MFSDEFEKNKFNKIFMFFMLISKWWKKIIENLYIIHWFQIIHLSDLATLEWLFAEKLGLPFSVMCLKSQENLNFVTTLALNLQWGQIIFEVTSNYLTEGSYETIFIQQNVKFWKLVLCKNNRNRTFLTDFNRNNNHKFIIKKLS